MARLLLVFSLCLAGMRAASSELGSSGDVPDHNTPKDIAAAWVRFHEAGLCQGVDAVFVFSEKGLEVKGVIEEDRSYEKLQEMLQPLPGSYKVELSLTRREEDKKADEKKDRDPPASLWENYELRSFLGDPFARARERAGFDDDSLLHFPAPDDLLKQRLLIYAEQVLDWNRRIERYAKHLPLLTRVSVDQSLAHGVRARANAAARAHAQEMERIAGKLNASLEPAFPYSGRRDRAVHAEKSDLADKTIVERAGHISDFALAVCLRVDQFIHPEQFTVGLKELREPSLLASLKSLQKIGSEFQKALEKAK
jgi:hypothetical protein